MVTTTSGKIFSGECLGVYGSVQNEEEYDRAETSIEIHYDGMATALYESEIKSIEVLD